MGYVKGLRLVFAMKAPVTHGRRNPGAFLLAGLALMTAAGALGLPTPARAASFTFDYDFSSPTAAPSGTGPWLQALIKDVSPGKVTITLNSLLQNSSEFFSGAADDPSAPVGIAFNLKDSSISLSGNCSVLQGDGCLIGGPQLAQPSAGVNGISSESQFQGFDVALFLDPLFLATPPSTAGRFNGDDIIQYTFTGTGLTADQFVATNPSSYCSAAKIGTLPNGSNTVVAAFCPRQIPSSEVPAPLPLLGAGAAFGFSRKLRRRIGLATATAHTPSA